MHAVTTSRPWKTCPHAGLGGLQPAADISRYTLGCMGEPTLQRSTSWKALPTISRRCSSNSACPPNRPASSVSSPPIRPCRKPANWLMRPSGPPPRPAFCARRSSRMPTGRKWSISSICCCAAEEQRGNRPRPLRAPPTGSGRATPLQLAPGQVDTQIELHLMIVGQHVFAELVERLVVLGLFQVGQFVHHDHLQEFRRGLLEQGGDADFLLRLELAALHPGNRGVQAEGAVGQVETVVEQHLVDGRRVLQVFLLERLDIGVERLVALHPVLAAVTLSQVVAQALLGDQLADLLL